VDSGGDAMAETSKTDARLVRIEDLRGCVVAVLGRVAVPEEHAGQIADVLLDSELRGHDDHGPVVLGQITASFAGGRWNPCPAPRVLRETEGALLLDADRGCGVIAANVAMGWCIERARRLRGMAVAGVRNSGWLISPGPYAAMAAEAGFIGFACGNSSPGMAPPGGRTRTVGTNPLALAFPGGRRGPILLDMATSAVAGEKVRLAAEAGRPIPEGMFLDENGNPTTDPSGFGPGKRGLMVPLGGALAGHKGFGLALAVDALAGVLTGAGFARSASAATATSGHTFWALDVEAFSPREEFAARLDEQVDQVKNGERCEGVEELFAPGERGLRRAAYFRARGVVPLSPATWQALGAVCAEHGLALPSVTH